MSSSGCFPLLRPQSAVPPASALDVAEDPVDQHFENPPAQRLRLEEEFVAQPIEDDELLVRGADHLAETSGASFLADGILVALQDQSRYADRLRTARKRRGLRQQLEGELQADSLLHERIRPRRMDDLGVARETGGIQSGIDANSGNTPCK